ncbi:glycosyltransferase [Spiribacter halobius]|uniref:Glycosyl transferase n=1 Tax=Sediminicurvatus halobius TaxID=2182432 RepID=A0A2U2MXN4_9GAMM|nr:glycosyltransferase [Spiribacter halobius]PWG61706.1 glycosyl transferase [Spiribacter halobius]UEX77329.1 glycosyltransferase [Spiribacter halobius]
MRAEGGGPAVSVITPCFNAVERIGASVRSVMEQSYHDWELIVVDDGSVDGSADAVRRLDCSRLRLIEQENAGPSAARNHGLLEACGRYIAFLDADDTWHEDFLATMVAALDRNHEAVLAYCGWQNLGVVGGRGEPFVPPEYESPSKAEVLLGGCRWPIHAALTRAECIDRAGGFDETLRASVDYDLWLRVATQGPIVRVPKVLAYYYHHGGDQVTKNRLRVAMSHWTAQRKFIEAHPEVAEQIGPGRVRELLVGELLLRGYRSYWARDLDSARALFRAVMRHGYGRPRDWVYMIPSLLPRRMHGALLNLRDRGRSQ